MGHAHHMLEIPSCTIARQPHYFTETYKGGRWKGLLEYPWWLVVGD